MVGGTTTTERNEIIPLLPAGSWGAEHVALEAHILPHVPLFSCQTVRQIVGVFPDTKWWPEDS